MPSMDWPLFTPAASLVGGVLIGLAASALMLMIGRIAGISGIVGGLLSPGTRSDRGWRIAFVLGLLAAPFAFALFHRLLTPRIDASFGLLVAAGLLVGVGTRYGSGCTSGHGVCGLSRLSMRSLAATLSFMAMGFITVALLRHLLPGGVS